MMFVKVLMVLAYIFALTIFFGMFLNTEYSGDEQGFNYDRALMSSRGDGSMSVLDQLDREARVRYGDKPVDKAHETVDKAVKTVK